MTTPDLTRDLTYDEVEKIILATEVSELSDRGDRVWTRRMAVALADKFNARLSAFSEPAAPAGAEVVALEWEPSDDEMGENGLRFISRPGLRFYMISKMWHGQLGERWELNGGKDYATLDEAKAAAQANFAAKIRSALATPQPVEPPDDSLNEAARDDECERHVAAIHQIASERNEAESKSAWQPIEAAPKSLDVVLIYDPETKSVGQGHRIDLREYGDPEWIFQATGWRCAPSHWMPMPDAPTAIAHPDDIAVDRFAAAMKAKLALKRAEGRGGWEDPTQCTDGYLSSLLRNHVEKGDPVDVGNLAMMLHQRGERITR